MMGKGARFPTREKLRKRRENRSEEEKEECRARNRVVNMSEEALIKRRDSQIKLRDKRRENKLRGVCKNCGSKAYYAKGLCRKCYEKYRPDTTNNLLKTMEAFDMSEKTEKALLVDGNVLDNRLEELKDEFLKESKRIELLKAEIRLEEARVDFEKLKSGGD